MVNMSNLLNLQITIFCLMMAGYILTKLLILNSESRKHLLVRFVLTAKLELIGEG